jgi:hypothetical protein
MSRSLILGVYPYVDSSKPSSTFVAIDYEAIQGGVPSFIGYTLSVGILSASKISPLSTPPTATSSDSDHYFLILPLDLTPFGTALSSPTTGSLSITVTDSKGSATSPPVTVVVGTPPPAPGPLVTHHRGRRNEGGKKPE